MTARTQGVALAVLGVVLVRLSLTGEYLRFVTPWMRWPLLVAGVGLLLLAARPLVGPAGGERGGPAPRSAWLLLLPTVVVFAVAPPPLGAYFAERRADQVPARTVEYEAPLDVGEGPVPLSLGEFAWGAAQPDDPMGLRDRAVVLEGFVSRGGDEGWFVTGLEIFCCAADAAVVRVEVDGAGAPARDQWVRVTGTWLDGTGAEGGQGAALVAERVEEIQAPGDGYG